MRITTILSKTTTTVNGNAFDEVRTFCKSALKKHRHLFGLSVKSTPDVLVVIKLSNGKILRLSGKLSDQLTEGDSVLLVTSNDWTAFKKVLEDRGQVFIRLGKPQPYEHPSSMTKQHLEDFIRTYSCIDSSSQPSSPEVSPVIRKKITPESGSSSKMKKSKKLSLSELSVNESAPKSSPAEQLKTPVSELKPNSISQSESAEKGNMVPPPPFSPGDPNSNVFTEPSGTAAVEGLVAEPLTAHIDSHSTSAPHSQYAKTNFVSDTTLQDTTERSPSPPPPPPPSMDQLSKVLAIESGEQNVSIPCTPVPAIVAPFQSPLANEMCTELPHESEHSTPLIVDCTTASPDSRCPTMPDASSCSSSRVTAALVAASNIAEFPKEHMLELGVGTNVDTKLSMGNRNDDTNELNIQHEVIVQLEIRINSLENELMEEREKRITNENALTTELKNKNIEIEEMLRLQMSLQGRLEETRFMLRILASGIGNHAAPPLMPSSLGTASMDSTQDSSIELTGDASSMHPFMSSWASMNAKVLDTLESTIPAMPQYHSLMPPKPPCSDASGELSINDSVPTPRVDSRDSMDISLLASGTPTPTIPDSTVGKSADATCVVNGDSIPHLSSNIEMELKEVKPLEIITDSPGLSMKSIGTETRTAADFSTAVTTVSTDIKSDFDNLNGSSVIESPAMVETSNSFGVASPAADAPIENLGPPAAVPLTPSTTAGTPVLSISSMVEVDATPAPPSTTKKSVLKKPASGSDASGKHGVNPNTISNSSTQVLSRSRSTVNSTKNKPSKLARVNSMPMTPPSPKSFNSSTDHLHLSPRSSSITASSKVPGSTIKKTKSDGAFGDHAGLCYTDDFDVTATNISEAIVTPRGRLNTASPSSSFKVSKRETASLKNESQIAFNKTMKIDEISEPEELNEKEDVATAAVTLPRIGTDITIYPTVTNFLSRGSGSSAQLSTSLNEATMEQKLGFPLLHSQLLQHYSHYCGWFGYKFNTYTTLCVGRLTPLEIYYAPYLRALRKIENVQTVLSSKNAHIVGGVNNHTSKTYASATTLNVADSNENQPLLEGDNLLGGPTSSTHGHSPSHNSNHSNKHHVNHTMYGAFDVGDMLMRFSIGCYIGNGAVNCYASTEQQFVLMQWKWKLHCMFWALFQVYGKADGILVKYITFSQIITMLRDAKIVSYKTEAHGSLSVSALQLKYKKLFLLQQQKSKKIDVLTKTGTIQKGVNHSASTTSDGPGLGFQQFMLYMDTVSHLIHDQFGKKLGLEENLINFHSESVKGNASIGSFASYGLTMGLDCRYITLELLFSNLCRSKGSELEINSTLRGTEICRSGMTKVAKTAFDKAGSFQLLDPNYSVLNVITSSSSDGGLTPGLQDGISILLRDISVFAVASDDAGEDDHPVACCEYPATPPGVNVFYGSTRVVHLWSMNAEQIRQIFWYYARSVDLNRHSKLKSQQLSNGIHVDYNHTTGSGANNNGSNCGTVGVSMLTFENCKECLMDFGIVPKYIDLVTLTRVFRSVKLWEWYMGELYLIDRLVTAATLNQPVNTSPKDELSSVHMNINLSQVLNLDTTQCFHDTFPYDFTTSLGNLSLTICGFIELLTRLSNSGKLAAFSHVDESVDNYVPRIETLLRVMDSSGGKEKLIKSHRRSVCVRHFKYYPK